MKIGVIDDYQNVFRERRVSVSAIDQIVAFAPGKPINVVNPEALAAKA